MSLDPRAVALQGVGFTPRLVALQGFGQLPQPAQREIIPGFSRRYAPAKKRKDNDDDVLMAFLLH